jgi:hypothetical protein
LQLPNLAGWGLDRHGWAKNAGVDGLIIVFNNQSKIFGNMNTCWWDYDSLLFRFMAYL